MREFWQDLRLGLRMLARDFGFVVPVIFTLALAIALNAVAFSLVNALIFRSLPVRSPSRLVQLITHSSEPGSPSPFPWSFPDFADYRDATRATFSGVALFAHRGLIEQQGDHIELVRAADVSGSFFQVMGLEPLIGRTLTDADDSPTAPAVVVIDRSFWRDEFADNPIGKTIRLNGHLFTVVGVVDGRGVFQALGDPQIFVPLHILAVITRGNELASRGMHWAVAFARLRPGISLGQGRAALSLESQRLAENYPQNDSRLRVTAVRAGTFAGLSGSDSERTVLVAKLLWAVAFLLLLIACANGANLSLTRGIRRLHEIAIRLALGASRARVAQQLLAESLLLCAAAGVLGCLLALAGLNIAGMFPAIAQFEPRLDGRVLVYAALLMLGATLLFGLAPFSVTLDTNLMGHLQVRRPSSSRGQQAFRRTLGAAQVALSVVLLVGTGLVLHSLIALEKVNLGFDPSQLLVAEVDFSTLTGDSFKPPSRVVLERMRRALALLPGIKGVSFADKTPLDGIEMTADIQVPGYTPKLGEELSAQVATVGDDYFRVLGEPVIRGQGFDDLPQTQSGAALISETMAKRYWSGRDAIGQQVVVNGETLQVVGIVGDVHESSPSNVPGPSLYYRYPSEATASVEMLISVTDRQITGLQGAIVQTLHRAMPELPQPVVESMNERLRGMWTPLKNVAWCLGAFGAFALLLASVGLFAIISYDIAARRQEFGIRMAMGATASDVLRIVLLRVLKLAAVGIVVGVLISVAAGNVVRHLLFGISPLDPATFVGVVLLLLIVAITAGAVPARQAARLDPSQALREE